MNKNIGQRIKSARIMAGMSMQALSDAAGNIVSKQAISKYEKGQIENINSTVLLSLAKAMNIKIDYFFKDSTVELQSLEFRKNASLSKKNKNSIEQRTIDFIEKYLEIEDILDASKLLPLNRSAISRTISNRDDAVNEAKRLRQDWKLGNAPVSNLLELVEENGIKIFEISLEEGVKFDGLSARIAPSSVPVIALKKETDIVRKRFTVAHELCHILFHVEGDSPKDVEKYCNAFANELLLPEEQLIEAIGKKRKSISMFELKKLKGIYGISIQAILYKACELNIISDRKYRSINIVFAKNNWKKNEPGSYLKKEKANRFKQLVLHAVSESYISLGKAASLLNTSLYDFRKQVDLL
ncbi:MAG: ImmA/IrrE family metallo-endopeptidase [Desulfobacula sp.]|jgi:Zn-dependent peptidase ImmA (M78 family)/DNA-binding XRE family transcriptional regulator|nr:ImmA/IrrE family metallo-endopeptidase [Desulfobacula sp.]